MRLEKVATPALDCTVVVPLRVPSLEAARILRSEPAPEVIVLLSASATRMIGWVPKTMPAWASAAAVCTISWVGTPKVSVICWVALVRPVAA